MPPPMWLPVSDLFSTLLAKLQVLMLQNDIQELQNNPDYSIDTVIDELHKKGITIISITHNEEQSLRTANRRITIVDGQLAKEEVLR